VNEGIIISLQGNLYSKAIFMNISLQEHAVGLQQNKHFQNLPVLVISQGYQFGASRLNERCL
jgi:hypothetical protein